MGSFAAAATCFDEDSPTDAGFSVSGGVARPAAAATLSNADFQLLRRLAVKLARAGADPDDLLQDALERAIRHFDRFTPGTNLNAWLGTIMNRLVIDQWRKRSRRQQVSCDQLVAPDPDQVEPEPIWTRYSVDQVREAARQLREPLRTTFDLFLNEGLAYAAIARQLGVPLSTVGTRLRRARHQVRKILEAGPVAAAAVATVVPLGRLAKSSSLPRPSSGKASLQWYYPPALPAARRPPGPETTTRTLSSRRRLLAAITERCSST